MMNANDFALIFAGFVTGFLLALGVIEMYETKLVIRQCSDAEVSDSQPKWWRDAKTMAIARRAVEESK